MGQATVRAAIVNYLSGANIPGITLWLKDAPWYLDGGRWNLAPGQLYGAVAFPHIDRTHEERITLPAQTANKKITYTVSLCFQYQYLIQGGGEPDAWVDGLDTILDGIKAVIRADQNLGTDGHPIFEAGEDVNDLATDIDLPILDDNDGGRVYMFARVEVTVIEIITA